jgi:hypothetical protein
MINRHELMPVLNRGKNLVASIGAAAFAGTVLGADVAFMKEQVDTGILVSALSLPVTAALTGISISRFDQALRPEAAESY